MIGFALTEEQLSTLLKMVFIANIIGNSPRQGKEFRKDFLEIEEYIFERGKNTFPMAVHEHKVAGDKHHHPSMIFETDPDINKILDDYEEYVMPFLIAEKFAERDIVAEFGFNAKDKMTAEQYVDILEEKTTVYESILKEHGVNALMFKPEYL